MIGVLEALAKYNIPLTGLLHIGGNTAAEAHSYIKSGTFPIIFFEPIPRLANIARGNTKEYPNMAVSETCCSDEDDVEVVFNVASNNGQSSSILSLGRHQEIYPSITYVDKIALKTKRIETLLDAVPNAARFNYAVLDTQGAELKVLKGFGTCLDRFDALYVEVADQALYEQGATIRDISAFLDRHGFGLLHLESTPRLSYGNALFARRMPVYADMVRNAISVGKRSYQSSVYKDDPDYAAHKGNDGVGEASGFFHTESEAGPWWEVDLGKMERVSGVYIFDRIGYSARSDRLVIEFSDDGSAYRSVFKRHEVTGTLGQNYFVQMDDHARYVRVRIEGEGYLHLFQVAVV